MLRLIKDLLSDRKQSVVLNGQCSSWMDVQAGVLQDSTWTVINDLPDNLTPNPKLLADDTSLFSTVTDPNAMANQINNDLHNINTWDYQWKMNLNPDTSKHAQEVILAVK